MTNASPFSMDRFERDRPHLYHLPAHILDALERAKSAYVIGSRGTGKTTFLNALNWEERVSNPGLEAALGGDPFSDRFVGVYVNIPRSKLNSVGAWLEKEEQDVASTLFALYFDCIWLEVLSGALATLAAKGVLCAPASLEHEIVSQIVEDHHLAFAGTMGRDNTLRELSVRLRALREQIEEYAGLRSDAKEIYTRLRPPQVGAFGLDIGRKLARFCDEGAINPNADSPWYFKVCVDQAETLTKEQKITVNTMVRLSEWPVFFVFAFVSVRDDYITTVYPALTQQRADRDIIHLDNEIARSGFESFADGVAQVRIRHILRKDCPPFRTQDILGSLNINGLLEEILKRSESARARQILARAKDMQEKYERFRSATLPIYEAYLVERLNLTPVTDEAGREKQRQQESNELRKRMVAAYLVLCRELRADVRYASANMLFQMSDNCIRDYLLQMHEVFQESGIGLNEFLQSPLSPDRQHRALTGASTKKWERLPTEASNPAKTRPLVNGLALLTREIQSDNRSENALRSSERGKFTFRIPKTPGDDDLEVLGAIKDGHEAGFITIPTDDADQRDKLTFRVHTSLAARYGFSYRGAQYKTALRITELRELCSASGDEEVQRWVERVSARIARRDPGQLALWEDT